MSQYVSEIRLFAFDFVPVDWVRCDGASYSIFDLARLFELVGYRYGGEGQEFRVPDLNGRVLIHNGENRPPFLRAGAEKHVLTVNEMPNHNHRPLASSLGVNANTPENNFWASDVGYVKNSNELMHPDAMGIAGEDLGHNNMSPYLPLNYCISYEGFRPDEGYREMEEFTGSIKPFCKPVESGTWMKCDGQELPIGPFTELYSVIGNTYGGVESQTFRLPDLRGRALVGAGTPMGLINYKLGEKAGEAVVTLARSEMPEHNHKALASATATSQQPKNCGWGNYSVVRPLPNSFVTEKGSGAAMSTEAFGNTGGNEAHNNMMPYQAMEFMICVHGVKPKA